MTLRNRLFLSTSVQLLLIGAMGAFAFVKFDRGIVPDLVANLEHKARSGAAALVGVVDVGLAANDPAMVKTAVDELVERDDLAYVEVRDARGAVLYGTARPPATAYHGIPRASRVAGGAAMAWAPVALEGIDLGTVAIGYSTARIDTVEAWGHRFGAFGLIVWIGALLYSLRFSRTFVAPIRDMMQFSRKVASGRLDETLATGTTGELAELEEHLNHMAQDLAAQQAEREQTAARVEAMQRELLTATRMAGMAEVATGVLHNVGNVLNSLNVSVSVVGDRIRASKVSALARSVELFQHHPGGLLGLLATDKGKVLPDYLAKVSDSLAAEQAATLGELASIGRNVDHIKTIVATQQSYTRVVAVHEPTDLAALIDDALHMIEGSFQRHGIDLVKHIEAVPAIVTDRHKVLQILINLLSNARHALDESGKPERRLRIQLARCGDGIAIAVQDNGVGIPPENLERIFAHGFTTKKNGHGFGLHASANAATELGGELTVASSGVGAGATFTLELPLAPPAPGGTHARN